MANSRKLDPEIELYYVHGRIPSNWKGKNTSIDFIDWKLRGLYVIET